MKKLLTSLIVIVLVGGGAYAYYKYAQPADNATVQQVALTTGDITQAVQATGTLEALRTVALGSQVSGTVKSLNVDFNSIVHKGEVLAELDPTLLQVQVDVAQANIEKQQSDIANQGVQLQNDQKNLQRTQEQFDKGLISPQALEAAQLQVKTRQASITSLSEAARADRAELEPGEAERVVLHHQVAHRRRGR